MRQKISSLYRTMTTAAVLTVATALGGCGNDFGMHLKGPELKIGNQSTGYRRGDNRGESDQHLFQKDCDPYDNSSIAESDNGGSVYDRNPTPQSSPEGRHRNNNSTIRPRNQRREEGQRNNVPQGQTIMYRQPTGEPMNGTEQIQYVPVFIDRGQIEGQRPGYPSQTYPNQMRTTGANFVSLEQRMEPGYVRRKEVEAKKGGSGFFKKVYQTDSWKRYANQK